MTKNLLHSKTFWVNFLTLAATIVGFLPPKYAAIALPVANIILRTVTTVPVTILS